MILNSDFFTENREKLLGVLPENAAAFIFAGKPRPISQDTDCRFLPDRNFYYLTGISEPDSSLILYKGSEGETVAEIFVPEKEPMKERWRGKRMSFEEVSAVSGISRVRREDEFDAAMFGLICDPARVVAIDGASIMDEPRNFRERVGGVRTQTDIFDMSETLVLLRMIKSEAECRAIEAAGILTAQAIGDMKKLIKPGATELELYAALEYGMMKRGCLIPAFSTITAVGKNSFYLHHSEPESEGDGVVCAGDIIQIDAGARSEGYCADISRAFFVTAAADSGECGAVFSEENTPRMKLLNIIRQLRRTAFGYIKPGITLAELNAEVRHICAELLVQNGVIPDDYTEEDVSRYYWHNTAHHLGLDVHDCAVRERPLERGCCLAVEPGVYIPEWRVGFRIEDDVVVTETGCRLLTDGADKTEDIFC